MLHPPRMHRWVPAILLIALLSAFRVIGSAFPTVLPNFQPLPALILCSFIFLKGHQRWAVPTIVWLLTDPVTSLLQQRPVLGWHHLAIVCGLAATIAIAAVVRRRPTTLPVLGAAAASAVVFYFMTNLVSFVTDPLYPKSFEGFIQAQWTGPIGLGPTWVFLRNLVIANTLFTSLFLVARISFPQTASSPVQASVR